MNLSSHATHTSVEDSNQENHQDPFHSDRRRGFHILWLSSRSTYMQEDDQGHGNIYRRHQ